MWLLLFLCWVLKTQQQVCVVGGGASGMYAAVWLRDHNYSVLLLENQGRVGGHCDTINDPTRGNTSALDIGVLFWLDTQKLNQYNIGHWDVDTVKFVQRFAGEDAVQFVNLSMDPRIRLRIDMTQGINQGHDPHFPPLEPSPEYLDAWQRYFDLVNQTYSWVGLSDYPGNWFPEEIPPSLLGSFADWVLENNLAALEPLFRTFLNAGGFTPYQDWRTLDALLNLPPAMLKAVDIPLTGFLIKPGCQTMYNEMAAYVMDGGEILIYSQITSSLRTDTGITLKGFNSKTLNPFVYSCDTLVVACPQTLENLFWMDLDETELAVFSQVETEYYFDGWAQVSKGELDHLPFNLLNYNTSDVFGNPSSPAVISVARSLPSGYASILASSSTPISLQDMKNLIDKQVMTGIPSTLGHFEVKGVNYHVYEPNFQTKALNHTPNGYHKLKELQGYRNTYYIGSLLTCPGSYVNQEFVHDLFELIF